MCLAYKVSDEHGLSEKMGIALATVKNWKYRGSVRNKYLEQCRDDTKATVDWLLTGDPPSLFESESREINQDDTGSSVVVQEPVASYGVATPAAQHLSGKPFPSPEGAPVISPSARRSLSSVGVLEPVVLTASSAEQEPVQYEVIPMFQGDVGAEGGQDPRLGDIAFSLSFMARRFSGSDKLRMLVHRGDGMSPTLEHGEEIIIDTGIREVRVDGIYALRYQGGEEVVKRIQRMMNGTLVVRSDNERYDREEIAATDASRLEIMGMMVWPRVR